MVTESSELSSSTLSKANFYFLNFEGGVMSASKNLVFYDDEFCILVVYSVFCSSSTISTILSCF